jgi:hypothetical protein
MIQKFARCEDEDALAGVGWEVADVAGDEGGDEYIGIENRLILERARGGPRRSRR